MTEAWAPLLAAAGLTHIAESPEVEVATAVDTLRASGRPVLLALLKSAGVVRLSDRQRLAGAISKASRPESLVMAATDGDVDALHNAILLSDRAALDAPSSAGGVTSLMAATSSGHVKCVAILLEASCAVDATRSRH